VVEEVVVVASSGVMSSEIREHRTCQICRTKRVTNGKHVRRTYTCHLSVGVRFHRLLLCTTTKSASGQKNSQMIRSNDCPIGMHAHLGQKMTHDDVALIAAATCVSNENISIQW